MSTGTGVLNSFQYLETGILLAVTPRINSGGLVTLEVNQEVSIPDASVHPAANPNPTVTSRSAQTTVVVASGESIVLAGLIREDNGARVPRASRCCRRFRSSGAAFGTQSFAQAHRAGAGHHARGSSATRPRPARPPTSCAASCRRSKGLLPKQRPLPEPPESRLPAPDRP